ncbi:MAG: hypothetical protein PUE12_18165 [Oscillospiraceae bacterium]|nr:hypothetical protein [Oscillospiraceae bacterium]
MQLPKDLLSETYQVPDVILCQTNKEKICKLNAINLEGTFKFNSYSEISFDVPSVYCDLITGETKPTPYYNYVEGLRLVYLEGFGYFQLQDPEINGDGIQEYKHINAYSLEYALSQRYLETFIINKGDVGDTIGSIDGVILYNKNDVEHSLLNLALQKAYGWTVGHVDEELMTQSRSFEIDRQSIYDFIMNDICDTFKCYVEFDTINNTVNLYSENEIERHIGDGEKDTFELKNALSDTSIITINGHTITQYVYDPTTRKLTFPIAPAKNDIIEVTDEFKHKYDTDVIIAFENLSNEIKVNYSADDIKTVLTVKGADDLDIRDVNFGLPSIMNLDYYCTPEWMGDKLYNEYLLYVDKQNKYMSGFYSKDISGSTEESFNVLATRENFVAGNVQELSVNTARERFNVNGYVPSFNIDKITKEFNIVSETKQYNAIGNTDIFTEPTMQEEEILCEDPQVESITVQDPTEKTFSIESTITSMSKIILKQGETQRELSAVDYEYLKEYSILIIKVTLNVNDVIEIFTYKNSFTPTKTLKDDSIVYINDEEIVFNYNEETNELIINTQVTSQDTIKICTPTGDIVTSFTLSKPENKILSVKVDSVSVNYTISSDGKTITITDVSRLEYGSKIVVESILNKFLLQDLKDKIVSVKIDNQETENYILNETNLIITDDRFVVDSVVSIESIDTHFDLSEQKDKQIVSVNIGEDVILSDDQYQFDAGTGILTITGYELSSGDTVLVKLVYNSFTISLQDYKILSVKVDSNKVPYTFDSNTSVLAISTLDLLFAGRQVFVDLIDKYFVLNKTKNKITTILVDGYEIDRDEFSYEDNKLIITADNLTANSYIVIDSMDTSFNVTPFYGDIDSVWIDESETDEYIFDEVKNILTINDSKLSSNSQVLFKTIYNRFSLPNTQKVLTEVIVNGAPTENYTFASDILIIKDELHVGDSVVAEFIDNHFTVLNDVGIKHTVEVQGETIDTNEYNYDPSKKELTIYIPLKDGDKVSIITFDSSDALRVVASNAKEGEILIEDVTPTLISYTPKVDDYVVKIDSYTETLKQLYELIDSQLTEENSVPDEYKITEKIVTPENFNEENLYLPQANIKNLGEVYKIINQDSNGNNIAYKYYVCEMKMSVYTDDNGKQQQRYEYVWNERELVFGGDGINSLKERIDIYSAINDIQIAAEWDQKPQDSNEYKSYSDNLKKLQEAKDKLEKKRKSVELIAKQIQVLRDKIQLFSEEIAVDKNFAPDSLDRLSLFLREDEYSDDCFCVTEIDTDLDKINIQKELLIAGQKELKNLSKPKLSFSASIKNIYAMSEFQPILYQFNLGKFIKVRMRQDFIKKARLLEVQLNFSDLSNFSCTFGDLLSAKDQGDIHADLLAQAVSAGKAVASGSSYWQKGYDVATAIDEKIRRGLIDATTSIKSNSAGQDISWDNYGIHLRKVIDGVLDKHEGWITNNKFLYSDDNFQTTKSVFGNYTIEGQEYWGILAGCVSAGLIEGSHIIGGQICIGKQDDGTYAFKVDQDGTVTMNKGDAAEKLSYFSFDGDRGLIVGENKEGDYFSRVSAQRIEFCRKARIITVTSEPTRQDDNCDYILYQHQEGDINYYDYYKNPDFSYPSDKPYEPIRATKENFVDPEIKFGIPITYFANNTAYMKQAEIEGDLRVGTETEFPSISLGNFKLQIESNGSLSIIAIQ